MFFGKDAQLPFFVSAIMGLQHCLAMLAGIITAPLLIFNDGCMLGDEELCSKKQYGISAALIASGCLSLVQVLRFKLVGGYFLGTGLLSVVGISFTFIPIARSVVSSEIKAGRSGSDAYGAFLGTCLVACWVEVAFSFVRPQLMRKLFPPVVTGTTVLLIGASLIAEAGIRAWGGGVFCSENTYSAVLTVGEPVLCDGNGEVKLGFGAPQYIGLGLVVILAIVLLQSFGSPFLKNTSVIVGLAVGYLVAALSSYHDPETQQNLRYVTTAEIDSAPWFSFLWLSHFRLGFHPPAFIPVLVGFLVTALETSGDVAASAEASRLDMSHTDEIASRVQGGLLADGLNSFFAGLMTVMPMSTFAQNNGVISLTGCASRAAGISCACWLMVFGIFSKFAGFVASIPDCVMGGMTTFLFANVLVSGIAIVGSSLTRRSRFILAMALGVGLGVVACPAWAKGGGSSDFYAEVLNFNYGLWPERFVCDKFPVKEVVLQQSDCVAPNGVKVSGLSQVQCESLNFTFTAPSVEDREMAMCEDKNGHCCEEYNHNKQMWRTTVLLILQTPYCIGTLVAFFLNLVLPHEEAQADTEALSSVVH